MRLSLVRNLTLLSGLLLETPALACSLAYCAQRLAPADGQTLPANAQALVAAHKLQTRDTLTWQPWIRRIDSDGSVQFLEAAPSALQPTGYYGDATLFLPGQLLPGERFRLESSDDCDQRDIPTSEVLVGDAAPIPERIGEPVSSPSIRVERANDFCDSDEPVAKREIELDIDESVRPWLSVARVNLEVNGQPRSTAFGGLLRRFDGGTRVLVSELRRPCRALLTGEPENTLVTWLVRLELELPGMAERPPAVEFAADMDCRQSCASVGVMPWLAGILLLLARRRLTPSH